MSDTDLKEKEEAAVDPAAFENEFGSSFSDDEKDRINDLSSQLTGKGKEPEKKRFKLSRRGKGIVGGITGLIGVGGTVGFIVMSPVLRLEGYMQQINQRVFSYASGAVEARAQHLLERYMIGYVLDLERCGKPVTNACRSSYGTGIAAGLFNNWKDVKIEEKLFDRYGLEVRSNVPDGNGGFHRVTLVDRQGRQINLSEGDLREGRFSGGDREFGREMRRFLRAETKWYEVMQRRGVRNYLERKHGVKSWCLMACQQRDNLDGRFSDAKTKLKYKLIERVIYPFSAKYGLILNCITSGGTGSKCSPEAIRDSDIDRNRIGAEEADDLIDHFNNNPNTRLSDYLIKKVVTKIFNEQVANKALGAIPIAGQIYLAVTLVDMFDRLDTFVDNNGFSKYAATINSSQYREYYTAMRSSTDEIKSGVLPLDEVGAIAQEFDGAEQSYVLQAANKNKLSSNSFFGATAYAATTAPLDDYTCINGKPVPEGDLVCNEKKVSRTYYIEELRDNAIVATALEVTNNYSRCIGGEVDGKCVGIRPRTVIRPIIDAINAASSFILGPITDGLMSIAQNTPGVGSVMDFMASKAEEFILWLMGKVFPLPITIDSPGRDKVDGVIAGGEVVAMEYAKGGTAPDGTDYGLKGVKLTPEQQAAIDLDQAEQIAYERSKDSLYNRMTDLENPDSIASNLIMKTPTDLSGYLAHLTHFFGIFSFFSTPVTAASSSTPDSPFGIDRYGYPLDDRAFSEDPEKYTEGYCQTSKELHEASKTEDPVTGFDQYSIADPCALERAAVDSAGALFSDD